MAKYVITGGKQLKGVVRISGNKNAILPCLAACLLTDEAVTLRNVPDIKDVDASMEIIQALGGSVSRGEHSMTIQVKKLTTSTLPKELVSKLRASILFVGPLLARTKKVQFSHPGG